MWWRELDDTDPISLEPISEAEREPVELTSDGVIKYYFNADLLAAYLLASGKMEHPVSRRGLKRDECARIDGLRRHMGGGRLVDLFDKPSQHKNEEAAERLRAHGIRATTATCDVSQEDEITEAARKTILDLGRIDACVASAGLGGYSKPLPEVSLETWRSVTSVNLDGVFLAFREATRRLIEQGEGGALVAVWLLSAPAAGAMAADIDAEAVVRVTTDRVLETLRQEGDSLKTDPKRLYDLGEDLVVPHFDFEKMSLWVLGR